VWKTIILAIKLKLLQTGSGFLKYFKNTAWLMGERLFKMSISFFIIILLTRYLGPKNFGFLSYAQSFIGMFVAFTTLGLEVIIVRELTKCPEKNNEILGTALGLKLIASVIAIAVLLLVNMVIGDGEAALLINVISFTLLFQSVNLGIDTYFQANVQSKISVLSNSCAFTISTIIKLGLIFYKAELIYFAYALVFDYAAITIGYLYIYRLKNRSATPLKFDSEIAISLLKSGWPMMMVAMAVFIYTKIDQVMIYYLMNSESVGYYAAAVRVSELLYFIPLLITQSVFPKIVQQKEKGDELQYFKLLECLYKLVLWIALPISLAVMMFSNLIVDILYGVLFSESALILSVLAFCLILVSIGSVGTKILYVEHFERKYLKRSIFGVFINISLNFILIKLYGAVGAAVSTLTTLFCIHYVYDLFDKELRKFYYLKIICFIPRFSNLSQQGGGE